MGNRQQAICRLEKREEREKTNKLVNSWQFQLTIEHLNDLTNKRLNKSTIIQLTREQYSIPQSKVHC